MKKRIIIIPVVLAILILGIPFVFAGLPAAPPPDPNSGGTNTGDTGGGLPPTPGDPGTETGGGLPPTPGLPGDDGTETTNTSIITTTNSSTPISGGDPGKDFTNPDPDPDTSDNKSVVEKPSTGSSSKNNSHVVTTTFPFIDNDGDAHQDIVAGGADCDDFDATIYPKAPEVCGDGIDQDCNGLDLECPANETTTTPTPTGTSGASDTSDEPYVFGGSSSTDTASGETEIFEFPDREEPALVTKTSASGSGSFAIFFIVLFVIIGAGAGAFFYFHKKGEVDEQRLAPLKEYLAKSKACGFTDDQIKTAAKQQGWSDTDIITAFGRRLQPVQPIAKPAQVNAQTPTQQQVQQPMQPQVQQPVQPTAQQPAQTQQLPMQQQQVQNK